jgi:release factor glutamine methyltransferase
MVSALTVSSLPLIPTPSHSTNAEFTELIAAIVEVGGYLHESGYHFTTVTPITHASVVARGPADTPGSLRAIFGWNLPFSDHDLPLALTATLHSAGLLRRSPEGLRSVIRFASIGRNLYAHDGFPTVAPDAVFFGPDTYRFVAAVRRHLRPCDLLIDLGCGSGAGGLESLTCAERLVLIDINPRAMAFANANRLLACRPQVLAHVGDLLTNLDEQPDAIIANPPYMADSLGRIYRDGAGDLGTGLSLRIVATALQRLAPDGQLILYTGSPIIAGHDRFAQAALSLCAAAGATAAYEELDPDVFGDELTQPAYREVDRIAAVLLTVNAPHLRSRIRSHAYLA